jgi:hypothetical protein
MRAIVSLAFGALLGLVLGCGSEEPEVRTGASAAAPAPPVAPAAAMAPANAEGPALPALGKFEVRVGPEGTVALANQAPRRLVLEAIARETGLVVVSFVSGGDPKGRVTLRSIGEPIEVVLARALAGVPFSIEPVGQGARLSVIVGTQGAAPEPPARARAETPRPPPTRDARPAPDDESETLEQLTSGDPEERVEAVEWLDVTAAAGYEAVVERLLNDPDPEVRAAAAESLGDADVGAVGPLLRALEDRESVVVLEALDSLELLGDASTVEKLEPVLDHPDPEVRERAIEVREFLE